MKFKRIMMYTIVCAMLLSAMPVRAAAQEDEELRISVNAGRESCIRIEDLSGNRFVYQAFEITENSLNLSVEVLDNRLIPGMTGSPYAATITISGKLDSYTITSEDENLQFSIDYREHGFTVLRFAGDSLAVLVENGEIDEYRIESAHIKPTYSITMGDRASTISMSVAASDQTLVFTPIKNDSFTIQGAESYAPTNSRYFFTDTVMDDGTLFIMFEYIGYTTGETGSPFVDVHNDDWFFDAARTMYFYNLMYGTSATIFSPNAPATRGMFVTILYRRAGCPYVSNKNSFDDVSSDKYYDDAVSWASRYGIVTGYSATQFGPDDAITREQLVTMLYRHIRNWGLIDTGNRASSFTDFHTVSEYAREAMEEAVKYGLITGKTENTLDPQGIATRAEMATIMRRLIINSRG